MTYMTVAGVMLLVCTSVSGTNITLDLQSYLNSLWEARKNNLMGSFLPDFSPKLDLKQLVELVRGQMSKPFPALGLPVLDPLDIEGMPFSIDHEIGRYDGHLKRLTILHLSQFQVDKLVLNLVDLKADFNISFHEIRSIGSYDFNGSFGGLMTTWGDGDFEINSHGLRFTGSVQVRLSHEILTLDTFNVDIGLQNTTGEITGLHGGGELGKVLSNVVLDLTPAIFDMVKPEFCPWLSKQVLEHSNHHLNKLSIKKVDVVDWLRQIATDKILTLPRPFKRDLSDTCTIKDSLFTATYC